MVKPADVLGLTPGYKLEPLDNELVEYYLLRRLLGQEVPLEGMILEDDPLTAPPWELLSKHEREDDDAFFFAHGQTIHGNGSRRNKRTCAGGGCWEGQKVVVDDKKLIVPDSGMEVTWKKYQLNYHNVGEKGSTGWVMHEYSVTAPADLASSSVRLYHISFSGHGKKRKREPYDYGRDDDGGAHAASRQAIAEESDLHLLEEQISAASHSAFPQDQDGNSDAAINGNHWPVVTSPDQDAPGGVIHEFTGEDDVAPLPLGQGLSSGAMDESFLDVELRDNINFDELFVFPDPCGLQGHLDGQFSGAGMRTQFSRMQPMPNPYYSR